MDGSRMARARRRMDELGVDVMLLSVGADLPYLTGYEAMPLERLTMLVLPRDGEATLLVPALEAPRVEERPGEFVLRPWGETEDPVALVGALAGRPGRVAVGDQTWARFVLALDDALGDPEMVTASAVLTPLRARKDADEVVALRAAAHAVDRVAGEMAREAFAGRTEFDVSRRFRERMLDAGHQVTNFAIVGSGPNGASPHHEPGERTIGPGDAVVCDFGGRRDGYCSDITRMYVVGSPPENFGETYDVLRRAHDAAVDAVRPGVPCEDVDRAARAVIDEAGLGDAFIHRTGHGIGLEAHEEPYLVEGNSQPLEVGHAFSIEPGIYLAGRFGMRLEDIVVVTDDGADVLNLAPHDPFVVG